MKKGIVLCLVAIICTAAIAQDKKTIEPSGKIITKEIAVKSFDAIRADAPVAGHHELERLLVVLLEMRPHAHALREEGLPRRLTLPRCERALKAHEHVVRFVEEPVRRADDVV